MSDVHLSTLSPVKHLLVVGLAVAGGLAVVVWDGAKMSSIAAGHGSAPVGLGQPSRAIPGLIESPGRPSLAWPADVRDRIVPAPLYWVATAASAALVITVGSAVRVWRGLTPRRQRLGVDAHHDRFASRRELRPLIARRPGQGRFVFGG